MRMRWQYRRKSFESRKLQIINFAKNSSCYWSNMKSDLNRYILNANAKPTTNIKRYFWEIVSQNFQTLPTNAPLAADATTSKRQMTPRHGHALILQVLVASYDCYNKS